MIPHGSVATLSNHAVASQLAAHLRHVPQQPVISRTVDADRAPLAPHASEIVALDGIWVARRNHFKVGFREVFTPAAVRRILFEHLPLADHGWNFDLTQIVRLNSFTWKASRT